MNKLYRRNNNGVPTVWWAELDSGTNSITVFYGLVRGNIRKEVYAVTQKDGNKELESRYNEKIKQGYQYYDWNGSSGDGAVRTTEQLVDQATSFHDNNIILLSHDSETKDTTVEALPKIIEYYQSQGYVFKALDLNSYVAHHGVNN